MRRNEPYRVFGIDLSKWQKGFDFAKAKKEGVNFVILRAMYHYTPDTCFEQFYQKAKENILSTLYILILKTKFIEV